MSEMSEMIERVAKEIEKACSAAADSVDEYCSPAMAKAAARAAIEAMREPTDEQRNRYFEMKIAAGGWPGNAVFVDAEWERMVDAALAEPKA